MTSIHSSRWLMSFADLTLVLLAFFVLLHARADGRAAAESVRAAFSGHPALVGSKLDLAADALFEPGEAMLRPAMAARLRGFGHAAAAAGRHLRVQAAGSGDASARFDAWELAAARAAAVARAVAVGGLDPQAVEIAMPQDAAQRQGPQRFTVGPA